MLIVPHYHDWELVVSASHPDLAFEFGELPAHLVANAMRVLLEFGVPSRRLAGRHDVLSFIRSPALTAAIPGAKVGGDHEAGLAMDFRPGEITPATYWELATSGELAAADASWDKLNMYTQFEVPSFHVGLRPVTAGAGRMRLYVDWERID